MTPTIRPFPNLTGCRFVTTHDVDRYPFFVVPAGTHGTVVEDGADEIWAALRFLPDDPIKGAEEWDGCAEFYSYGPAGEPNDARIEFVRHARPLLTDAGGVVRVGEQR